MMAPSLLTAGLFPAVGWFRRIVGLIGSLWVGAIVGKVELEVDGAHHFVAFSFLLPRSDKSEDSSGGCCCGLQSSLTAQHARVSS
jgi:hypothetical protein